jgi:hypothetical protein
MTDHPERAAEDRALEAAALRIATRRYSVRSGHALVPWDHIEALRSALADLDRAHTTTEGEP